MSPKVRTPCLVALISILVVSLLLVAPAARVAGAQEAVVVVGIATHPAASVERLEAAMQAIVDGFSGRIGVYAQHIETGLAAGVDPDTPYGMASTYKVPIVVEAMARVDAGYWTLDTPIELSLSDQHIGSGLISSLYAPGLTMSMKNLATLMIILSDNSATDMMIDRLGAAEITARMRALGLDGIRVDRTTLELILDYSGVEYEAVADATLEVIADHWRNNRPGPDAAAAARAAFYESPKDKATARDMTGLLVMIGEGRALKQESCGSSSTF